VHTDTPTPRPGRTRTTWAAIGAAVAISLGAGGLGIASATISSGDKNAFVPITPCRLFDTRSGPAPAPIGPRSTPIGANETVTYTVRGANGQCNIPNGASAVVMSVAGLNQTSGTFVTLFPADVTLPTAASLNLGPGATSATANLVTVKLSATGQISVYNRNGTVNLVGDIVGYYEDHNHDDRYYTEAEVDAAIAAAATAASAGYTVGPLDVIDFGAAGVDTTIATLNLPAGNFVVNANVVANTNTAIAGQETMVGCRLQLGTTVLANMFDSNFLLAAENTSGERESIALTGAGTLAAAGTATLVCTAQTFPANGTATGSFIGASVSAVKVGTVTRQ
jgi:hypothetical protein